MAINIINDSKLELLSAETLQETINHISMSVALLILAVPEGLSLIITIIHAFSIGNHDYIINKLDASEKLGSVKEIIISKSGILVDPTKSTVLNYFAEDKLHIHG